MKTKKKVPINSARHLFVMLAIIYHPSELRSRPGTEFWAWIFSPFQREMETTFP
jgi:hypothetical protein